MSIDIPPIRLTTLAGSAGCAAKMGPQNLAQVVSPLKQTSVPLDLLVGLDAIDDAAVYRLNDQQAVISTADFFPPVVDDPYSYGAIAAANAVSDIYAMGGKVLMAINLVAWPDDLDPAILREVLRGGSDIIAQAGGAIAGGHTIIDNEPKYGLSVTGLVHPDHILTKGGAQPGDILVLSKPLGAGLITTAQKRNKVSDEDIQAAIASMTRLNLKASEALVAAGAGVHAATDVTGFGIMGHAREMAIQSLTNMRFELEAFPLLQNARHYAELGCIPGGAQRNKTFLEAHVCIREGIDPVDQAILWDPQTSGGLFAAVDPAVWPQLAAQAPDVTFWRIGEVTDRVDNESEVVLEVR
ncbi:selenide, water dikinase SelD [Dictyobacter formicarum]|uniref:Selenide, water dikinase n=1 Tax=Dictyobacter formicarum TaxID=2778368 RepID=A0ABQ3VVS4_9CHLR|nr:selenide, water dikinase SelD [Dictyobacter formicarum]GHO89663.1 selenide, water dikinase [Dictyobacter formicarum]